MVSFFLVLECLNEIWANFDFFAPTMLYIIDKVGNFGHFDDKTLFGNESNLHTKIAFTHNVLHWTHNVRPAVSLSAIKWSTDSIFAALAWKKVEMWGPKQRILMRDPSKLISLLSSPLGRHWERGQLSPHEWRARKFWLVNYASHVCRSGRMITSACPENFCCGYCLFYANPANIRPDRQTCWSIVHKIKTFVPSTREVIIDHVPSVSRAVTKTG